MSRIDRAIDLDPDFAFGYNNRGFAYIKKGDFQKAFRDLTRSQVLDPTNSWVYRNWACYYALTNQPALAVDNLQEALRLGYNDYEWIKNETCFDSIRLEMGYQELMAGK